MMRNHIFIIVLLFFIGTKGFSQEETKERKNVVYVEMAGPVVAGIGLAYERYLPITQKMRFNVGGGLGMIDSFTKYTTFLGGGFIYGKKYGFELGMNYLFNYDAFALRSVSSDERFLNDYQLLIGYRYQNWRNGFLFRFYYVPPVGCCGSWVPYAGMSFGYGF